MSIQFTNFATTILASSINAGATSITVRSGDGALFPQPATGDDYFYAVLVNTSAQREVVKVTARSTDVMTVVRAQEGTSALTYNVGDIFAHRVTAASLNALKSEAIADVIATVLILS